MIGIDTNVIVRYLTHDDPEQAPRAIEFIELLTPEEPGYISDIVWVESFWVLTRVMRIPVADVLDRFQKMIDSDSVRVDDYLLLSNAIQAAGVGVDFADALISGNSKAAGCRSVVTFDVGAARSLGWRLL